MLTRRQSELLDYLRRRMALTPVAPTYEEMADAIGLRSRSGIHRLVLRLEDRGYVRRLPYRARAVELVGQSRLEAAQDRIQGLEADLRSAVAVAWRHGAREWVELNYPAMAAKLRERERQPGAAVPA